MSKTKSKSHRLRNIIITICIILFTFIILSVISDETRNYVKVPDTVYNYNNDGYKAFYKSVMEFGYQNGWMTNDYKKYARFIPENSLMISINPSSVILNENEMDHIAKKVNDGCTFLFFLNAKDVELINKKILAAVSDPIITDGTYSVGKGKFIISKLDSEDIINNSMKSGITPAVNAILLIDDIVSQNKYEAVYFNEFYHNIKDDPFYDILGSGLVLFITQIIFAVILLMVYKGRRFGSPISEMSIVKRKENENVFALAGLYERTGSPNIIFEVNIEALFSDIQVYLGYGTNNAISRDELIKEALMNKDLCKLEIGNILKRYNEMDKKSINKRELLSLLDKIESIRKELN